MNVLPVARCVAVRVGNAICEEAHDGTWWVYPVGHAVRLKSYMEAVEFARNLAWAGDDERPTQPKLERPK